MPAPVSVTVIIDGKEHTFRSLSRLSRYFGKAEVSAVMALRRNPSVQDWVDLQAGVRPRRQRPELPMSWTERHNQSEVIIEGASVTFKSWAKLTKHFGRNSNAPGLWLGRHPDKTAQDWADFQLRKGITKTTT